jgi:hypothetical protein
MALTSHLLNTPRTHYNAFDSCELEQGQSHGSTRRKQQVTNLAKESMYRHLLGSKLIVGDGLGGMLGAMLGKSLGTELDRRFGISLGLLLGAAV